MHSQLGPKLRFHSWANNANLTSSPVIHGVVNQQFNAHTQNFTEEEKLKFLIIVTMTILMISLMALQKDEPFTVHVY